MMDKNDIIRIIADLKNPRSFVRYKAAERLMSIKDPLLIRELVSLVRDESDYVKIQICRFLGDIRAGEGVAPLMVFLASESEMVSREAARALDNIKSPAKNDAYVLFLGRMLARSVKIHIIKSLGRERVSKAVPCLIEMLSDKDEEYRQMAIEALRQIEDPMVIHSMVKHLRSGKNEKDAYPLLLALGELDGQGPSFAVSGFLGHENPVLRRAAVWALANMGYKRCSYKLMSMLRGDPDERVRIEIAKRLGKLTGSAAVKPLIQAVLFDKKNNVRTYAAWSLKNMPLPEKQSVLTELLRDREGLIRARALLELARTGEKKLLATLEKSLKAERARNDNEQLLDEAEKAITFIRNKK